MSIDAPVLLVDHASTGTATVASETSPAIGVSVAIGDTIIVFAGGSGPTVNRTITDSQGTGNPNSNVYSEIASASGPISSIAAFICTVTTALGPTDTLTAHNSTNATVQIIANAHTGVLGVGNVVSNQSGTHASSITMADLPVGAGSVAYMGVSTSSAVTGDTHGTGWVNDQLVTSAGSRTLLDCFAAAPSNPIVPACTPNSAQSWAGVAVELVGTPGTLGTISNNFETGHASGTAITAANSGDGAAGNKFDNAAFTGAGTYDNTEVAHGSLACKIVTGTGGANVLQWGPTTLTHNSSPFYPRFNMFWPALPAVTTRITKWEGGSNVIIAELDLTAAGLIRVLDAAGTVIYTFTNAIPVGSWFRVEADINVGATTGTIIVRLFTGMDDVTPVETSGLLTGQNLSANGINFVQIGQPVTVGTSETFWIDDVAISDVSQPGPVGPAPPVGNVWVLGGITY